MLFFLPEPYQTGVRVIAVPGAQMALPRRSYAHASELAACSTSMNMNRCLYTGCSQAIRNYLHVASHQAGSGTGHGGLLVVHRGVKDSNSTLPHGEAASQVGLKSNSDSWYIHWVGTQAAPQVAEDSLSGDITFGTPHSQTVAPHCMSVHTCRMLEWAATRACPNMVPPAGLMCIM
jgi:hypothetical protein